MCSSQALSSERNSASAGLSFPPTLHNPCFISVITVVLIIRTIATCSCFIDHLCFSHCRHRCRRRRSINGVDLLVFRFCQTFPTVCPLVTFLATVATLAFKLGGPVRVSRDLCFPLLSYSLSLWRGRPHAKHPFPLPLPTAPTSIGVALALLGSDSTPRPSLSETRPN